MQTNKQFESEYEPQISCRQALPRIYIYNYNFSEKSNLVAASASGGAAGVAAA
jgi:hypothetical protein